MDGGATMRGALEPHPSPHGPRQTRAPVTADLRVERVAAVIARPRRSFGWIGVCDERAVHFTDQGRRMVVRGPAHASRRTRRRGSDIPHHPLEGASR